LIAFKPTPNITNIIHNIAFTMLFTRMFSVNFSNHINASIPCDCTTKLDYKIFQNEGFLYFSLSSSAQPDILQYLIFNYLERKALDHFKTFSVSQFSSLVKNLIPTLRSDNFQMLEEVQYQWNYMTDFELLSKVSNFLQLPYSINQFRVDVAKALQEMNPDTSVKIIATPSGQ
jgi:hypothetical protein